MKISTCVYLVQNHNWLMLFRDKKENDVNHGKYIGVGGKLKDNESVEQCAIREVFEETNLHVQKLQLQGSIDFIYPENEPEKIYVYITDAFDGTLQECDEGTLSWVHESKILSLPLWQGDRIFLKRILKKDIPFHLTFYYDANDLLQNVKEENVL